MEPIENRKRLREHSPNSPPEGTRAIYRADSCKNFTNLISNESHSHAAGPVSPPEPVDVSLVKHDIHNNIDMQQQQEQLNRPISSYRLESLSHPPTSAEVVKVLCDHQVRYCASFAKQTGTADPLYYPIEFLEYAPLLGEESLEELCYFGFALLFRGASGRYFLETHGSFRMLGTSLEDVLDCFLKNAKPQRGFDILGADAFEAAREAKDEAYRNEKAEMLAILKARHPNRNYDLYF